MDYSDQQQRVIDAPLNAKIFLEGVAGTGKTTATVARLAKLLQSSVSGNQILVLTPQSVLASPYHRAIRAVDAPAGGQVEVLTFGGLVLNTVKLFWALGAEAIGFDSQIPPSFLTLETSQYIMSKIVDPLMDINGYFETVTIDRNRLYSQIIDNLEKAALSGFPHTQIADRLRAAWIGDTIQERMFDEAQDCANRFRQYCLEHNLLDFSLQVELFMHHLWNHEAVQAYWFKRHPHLIVDNIEEGTPAMHAVVAQWVDAAKSALLTIDEESGFRRFLSADPDNAHSLRSLFEAGNIIRFDDSFVTSPPMQALEDAFAGALGEDFRQTNDANPLDALHFELNKFYPEMLRWVADQISLLVKQEQIPPREIVVLAPYLSDALRFTLMKHLEGEGVPVRSHRPSRALREEPAARCLLTLAALAHPEWGIEPPLIDVAYMFMQAIGSAGVGRNMDLIRAQLLAGDAYPHAESKSRLKPFEALKTDVQERVTFVLAPRYEELRNWIESYIAERANPVAAPTKTKPKKSRKKKATVTDEIPAVAAPLPVRLDHFFSRLFGEVLSQRGYGFYADFDAATVVGNLVDSAANFRRALEERDLLTKSAAQEYVENVARGLIADQYVRAWTLDDERTDAVLIAPAYTFLMRNQPVEVQFWLDIGNRGWAERLFQPLTHPYVLSRSWNERISRGEADKWTDEEERKIRQESLFWLVTGLIRRCRHKVFVGLSELGESGYESQGELLNAFNRLLRRQNIAQE